ncbi:MAG TPA: DNA methyltransferase [Nitrospiraceae bacterium]|jgi:fido (protein-threonine AMPylation protein)/predicted type IV restriction endonuclease|nr:DNA methyltransferase [Nitrospiraceae bacterium]
MSQAPPIVATLIDRFEQNRESYKSQGYNETQLRREFLDPFFEALGWDVANKQGHAEAYKDVIHEVAIKIGGYTKSPDYCFRIGGARKFFLEAKKPAVNLRDDLSPAYQLRRYAWSAKLPLSILTDFEEFVVYDCRNRPNLSDKPSAGRVLYLTYRDYLTRWDEIASIFTKDAVLKGSFDKYAVTDRKRGTATVDAEFLKEIETWREALAKNLALRNPKLSVHELNFSVQRTIDRLIFLRICEDRGVEPYAQLQALLNGQNIYGRLRYIYEQADDRYNSGLFHFHPEKDRAESPDDLTPRLKIDDKVLKDILGRLYYPQSPYEFSVFPTEILGQVYEQFLGKVIRLTAGHQAKVEEKPEVKKAGGVYYTPAYIVEYIVKHTVGALCEGKAPKQISKLRILDPACGSGSFLIGAYRYLLNYHRDWYVKDGPEKHRKELFQAASGEWRLTTQEKKRILLNNIYGVDIDSQAVEVTKLSLLLKVLEGESDETLKRQLSFVHERALPDLGQNIKCGNSLIEPDYFAGELLPDEDEMRRVNPFDWKVGFPEIMSAGGFNAVIGNPPYLYSAGQKFSDYLTKNYQLCQYQTDYYVYFIERALQLARKQGKVSFIVSDSWLNSGYFSTMRNHLLSEQHIDLITVFDYPVFERATIENSIFALTVAGSPEIIPIDRFVTPTTILATNKIDPKAAQQCGLINPKQSYLATQVLVSIEQDTKPLSLYARVNRGIHAYRTDGYGKSKFGPGSQTKKDKDLCSYHANKRLNDSYLPELKGKDVDRFIFRPSGKFVSYGLWLAEPREPEFFFRQKVALRKILGPKLHGTFLEKPTALDQSLYILISKNDDSSELKHILGILLSRLGAWYLRTKHAIYDVLYPWYTKKQLAEFPIKPKDRRLILLVERMLDLYKQLAATKTPADKERLQRQIDVTDQEIDRLVYDLYGLTEEEIKIVEAASVASLPKLKENDVHESEIEPADRSRSGRRAAATVAQPTQYAREGGVGSPESPAGAGEPVHGVREPAGQYGSPQDPDGGAEGQSELGSTHEFETAEGRLSYQELSERLAVPLVAIYDEILQESPKQLVITSEWLCHRHKRLAGHLFPDWAGRFRDVNLQVGSHTPPPYYEVPIHMRQFCDDLSARLLHLNQESVANCAELLAWADWRFQWIHPFKDFKCRIGRVLLAALLYKLVLPHIETAPTDPAVRRKYLDALQSADQGKLDPLTEMWKRRVEEAL